MNMPKKRLAIPGVPVVVAALVLILPSRMATRSDTLRASGTVEGTEALVGFNTPGRSRRCTCGKATS
jgi:hypothetical protein